MSAVWYHDDGQKQALDAAVARFEKAKGRKVKTHIGRLDRFWLAEDYHQKYALRGHKAFERAFVAIYPDLDDFVDSTAATKVNAWLGGYGDRAAVRRHASKLGLTPELTQRLESSVR